MADMRVGNAKVMFVPDFMILVQKQRNTFLAVKGGLREMGFDYSLLFPAKLRAATTNTTNCFFTLAEARHRIKNSDDCADHAVRLESTGADTMWQNRRGQRGMKPRMDSDLSAVPDLKQRIRERRSALWQAAALSVADYCSSPDIPGSPSSDGGSSIATRLSVYIHIFLRIYPADIRHYYLNSSI
ncbi:hypothetical protein NDU88_004589 [Pleurodeles waltl]|uniref:Uncharacterized protein n=1 Tax=Pleurodeles waltl TaxID=8319 RepID=A0AAV7RK14_PLEWA|nr:hypothetical protein NDU88_004589 [Pleurodeles waltl]